jgi:hypothetical protein
MVGQNIAGTDDHVGNSPASVPPELCCYRYGKSQALMQNKNAKLEEFLDCENAQLREFRLPSLSAKRQLFDTRR